MVDLTDALVNGNRSRAATHRLDVDIRKMIHLSEPFKHHGLLRFHTDGIDIARRDGYMVQLCIPCSDLFGFRIITHHTKHLLSVGADGRLGGLDGILRHENRTVYTCHGEVLGIGRGGIAGGGNAILLDPQLIEQACRHGCCRVLEGAGAAVEIVAVDMYVDVERILFLRILLKEGPPFYGHGTFTFRDDMPSSQQGEKGEIVPEAVGLTFHQARQPLVPSVVPHLGVSASTLGTLLVLCEPGPEVGCYMAAAGTG